MHLTQTKIYILFILSLINLIGFVINIHCIIFWILKIQNQSESKSIQVIKG